MGLKRKNFTRNVAATSKLKSDQCGIETQSLPPSTLEIRRSNRTNVGLKRRTSRNKRLTGSSSNRTNVGLKPQLAGAIAPNGFNGSNRTNVGLKPVNETAARAAETRLKSDQCGIETQGASSAQCYNAAAQIGPMWD